MTGDALLALGFVCGIDVRGGGDRCFGDGGVAELGVGRTCFGLSFYGSSPPYFLRFFVVRVCDPCCLKKTQPLRRSPEERLEKKRCMVSVSETLLCVRLLRLFMSSICFQPVWCR